MKTSEVLRGARAILSTPQKWTKEAYARTDLGQKTGSTSEDAVCWCLDGAVMKASGGDVLAKADAVRLLEKHLGCGLWPWNDGAERTHGEVLAALDETTRLAEEQEGGP